jgi:hypothetical protein
MATASRCEIHNCGGTDNLYLNNIVYALPAANVRPAMPRSDIFERPAPCPLMGNVGFVGGNAAGITDAGNTWTNNVVFDGAGVNIWGKDPEWTGFTCSTRTGSVAHQTNATQIHFWRARSAAILP